MSELLDPKRRARRRCLLAAGSAACCAALVARPVAAARAAAPPGFAPLLAGVYTGQIDPSLCLVSEKYDGVRAIWDGHVLRHRSGREIGAPGAFLARLPASPLDGELWLGRGRFEAISGLVRRQRAGEVEWRGVRYMLFELPGAGGAFAERAARLASIAGAAGAAAPVVAAPQEHIADRAALQRRLDAVTRAGGEGLMLHLASAPEVGGRNDALLKLKPFLDAEAKVVGLRPGAGKYRDAVGALDVQAPDGRRFRVGSGLTDALRREPPSLGSTITYRYRDLTPNGLPRFPTYLRPYPDA